MRLILILLLLFTQSAYGATYYMRTDGIAINKGAAVTDCTIASTMNESVHDGEAFAADDIIKLCDNGGSFSILTIPSSGTGATDLITYQAQTGDTPVIDGLASDASCIVATDIEYITFDGITCQNTTSHAFDFTYTGNATNITFNDITAITGIGAKGIHFSSGAGDTITNFTVTSSNISSTENTIKLDDGIFTNVTISENTLVSVQAALTTHDVIALSRVDGTSVVEKNDISGGDHGITTNEGATAHLCNLDIRYNYIHDTDDDSIWVALCKTSGVNIYSNVLVDSIQDDCVDIDSAGDIANPTYAFVTNNTCVNPDSVGFDLNNADLNNPTGTFTNNIVHLTDNPDVSDSHHFVSLYQATLIANFTFDYNFYSSTTGVFTDGWNALNDIDQGDCPTTPADCAADTLVQWQTVAGEANSLSGNADIFSANYYYATNLGSGALGQGEDNCDNITGGLLVPGSTWPDNVQTFRPCPSLTGNEWPIGAYATRGQCPISMRY